TVRQVDGLPVDEDPPAALLPHFGKEDVEILAVDRKDGGAKLDLRAIRKGEDRFENLTGGTAGRRLPGTRAVRLPDRRVEQIQVARDISHRADGRSRVVRQRLLFDGNDRRKPEYVVNVRLGHLRDKALRKAR